MGQSEILDQPVSMVMTTGELVTADPEDELSSVWATFRAGQVGHVPVLSDGTTLVGIVSLADLLKRYLGEHLNEDSEKRESAALRVKHVMTKNIETIRPTSSVRHAAQLFSSGGFHSLLVTATDGELLGIVTSTDIIRALLGELPEP
jgi:CBS domain-containing protein